MYYDVLWCHRQCMNNERMCRPKKQVIRNYHQNTSHWTEDFPRMNCCLHTPTQLLSLSLARSLPTQNNRYCMGSNMDLFNITDSCAQSFKSIFNCLDEWLCTQRTKWAVATVLLQILQLACLRQKHTQPIKIVGNYELWGWLILILILNTPSMIGSQTPSAIVIKKIFLKSTRIN